MMMAQVKVTWLGATLYPNVIAALQLRNVGSVYSCFDRWLRRQMFDNRTTCSRLGDGGAELQHRGIRVVTKVERFPLLV